MGAAEKIENVLAAAHCKPVALADEVVWERQQQWRLDAAQL